MNKILQFFEKLIPYRRRIIQIYAAVLYNAHLKGFVTGRIFTGSIKGTCLPGMNCYSCPGAIGACPLGSIQNALLESKTKTPTFVLGIILLYCIMLGRTICGFLCPAGFLQELLYKIKTPKIKKNKVTYVLSYLKYVLLVILVVFVPLQYALQTHNIAVPAFCKYICPVGTFEGAVLLLLNPNNADLYGMLGYIFTWKFAILVVIIVLSIFMFRPFCRFLCPLGALYGLFNKISVLGIKVNKDKCTSCNRCVDYCKMDVIEVGDHECINCGECKKVCPVNAIDWKLISKKIKEENNESSSVSVEPKEEIKDKKMDKRTFYGMLSTILCLVLLIGTIIAVNVSDTVNYGNEIGDSCPIRTLDDVRSDNSYSISDFKGKVIVINFWYTDCTPCVRELPSFNKLKNTYSDDIEVFVIHDAPSYKEARTVKFIEDHNWEDWNVLFLSDNYLKDKDLNTTYYAELGGKQTFPMTVIVDQDGKITFIRQGELPEETLFGEVEKLLNK